MGEHQQPVALTFVYKTVDERNNYVDVFLPPRHSNVPLKAILYFHGGGLTVGNRRSWFPRWIYDRAMRGGHAFISADYTLLAPTSGHHILEDIKDTFIYIDKRLNKDLAFSGSDALVDASSMIVSGSSSGGLCAYLAALHAIPKPKGVLTLYGQGGDFFTPFYLSIKTKPFFLGREMLDPEAFRQYMWPFPPNLRPTSDSPLKYNPANHPTAPGWPANLRQPLCRLYLQQGVILDYYTGEHEPSVSSQLREAVEKDVDTETLLSTLRSSIPERHICLFPQFLVDPTFPPTFMIHGEIDSAVPVQDSYSMERLLNANGVKNSLRIIEGQEHSFDYADGAIEKYATLFDEVFIFVENVFRGN